jgi:DNA-binding transcriptional regulator LsrR (DeoR family)
MSRKDIAERYGVSETTVRRKLTEAKVKYTIKHIRDDRGIVHAVSDYKLADVKTLFAKVKK